MDDAATRSQVLEELETWLEKPMLFLSFCWLALMVVEFTRGLSPGLEAAGWIIWGIFVLDFGLRLVLAPSRWAYLRRNALTALSLVVPALRLLRILRFARLLGAARAMRGFRLVKVIGTLNRGTRALGRAPFRAAAWGTCSR